MHPFFEDYNFYAFVHRGGDEEKTENTLVAFQYSSDLGYVIIETDVQLTSDGKVVIFHDSDLKRIDSLLVEGTFNYSLFAFKSGPETKWSFSAFGS